MIFFRPLGAHCQSANAIAKMFVRVCVRPWVCDTSDPGQTREPMEFIFGIYLSMENSNPHPKRDASSPLRELLPRNFWVLWKGIRQLWAIAMKCGPNMPLGQGNLPLKFETCLSNSKLCPVIFGFCGKVYNNLEQSRWNLVQACPLAKETCL